MVGVSDIVPSRVVDSYEFTLLKGLCQAIADFWQDSCAANLSPCPPSNNPLCFVTREGSNNDQIVSGYGRVVIEPLTLHTRLHGLAELRTCSKSHFPPICGPKTNTTEGLSVHA